MAKWNECSASENPENNVWLEGGIGIDFIYNLANLFARDRIQNATELSAAYYSFF